MRGEKAVSTGCVYLESSWRWPAAAEVRSVNWGGSFSFSAAGTAQKHRQAEFEGEPGIQ